MPPFALALALLSALLHALWNLAVARSRDPQAAMATATALGWVLFLPVALVAGHVARPALPWAAASSLFELAYVVLLAAAYRRADLSVVYPIARGAAPALVLLAGLALGAPATARQAAGVAVVGAGILLVLGVKGRHRPRPPADLALAFAVALAVAAYTLLDKQGMRHASPFAYLELVMAMPAASYLGYAARARGIAAIRGALGARVVAAALALYLSFAAALAALALAPAAAVAAVRGSSVVMAALLARAFTREPVGARRILGAAAVAAGIALLAA